MFLLLVLYFPYVGIKIQDSRVCLSEKVLATINKVVFHFYNTVFFVDPKVNKMFSN